MKIFRSGLGLALAAASVLLVSHPVTAAEPQPGRLLASNCFQCHGTNGNPVGGFDRLAGKSAREIYEELREFQLGKEESGIMTFHARGYTAQQLRAIADFFSRQTSTR
jgi:cytochrome c553